MGLYDNVICEIVDVKGEIIASASHDDVMKEVLKKRSNYKREERKS